MASINREFERALNGMYESLKTYADAHRRAYGTVIGDDAVLGDAWTDMARSLIALLNGERGNIDGGTFDRLVRDLATVNGVDGGSL